MAFFDDLFGEIIVGFFEFFLAKVFRVIGAALRWIWRLGRSSYFDILDESGNGRRGLIFVIALGILIYRLYQLGEGGVTPPASLP